MSNEAVTYLQALGIRQHAIYDSNQTFYLNANDDFAYIYGSQNTIYAEEGNDKVRLKGEENWLDTGSGNDDIRIYSQGNQIYAGEGNDTVYFYSANNYVHGGDGDDYIYDFWTTDRDNTANGGAGNDYVYMGGGDDYAIYDFADNKQYVNLYHGGKGFDVLEMNFDYNDIADVLSLQLNNMGFDEWLMAFEAEFAKSATNTADFSDLGVNLKATQFESLILNIENRPSNDEPPLLSVSDASVYEGNPGQTAYLEFVASLSSAASHEVSFDFTTMDKTTQSLFDKDLKLESGTISFAPGELSKTIRVSVFADNAYEEDETIELMIHNVEGAVAEKTKATGTILNDDTQVTGDLAVDIYNSNSSASKVLYLDFDGELIENTIWNDRTLRVDSFNAKPFNSDGLYINFSEQEQTDIYNIWKIVAEDFALFDVNVTTDRAVFDAAQTEDKGMAVITSSGNFGYGKAWVNSFGNDYRGPVFIGSESYNDMRPIGDTVSHELGHMLGLVHDGISGGEEYFGGHGELFGGWAPIMGFGSNMPMAQWSKGEYANASNQEDDIAVMGRYLDIRQDDHGNDIDSATLLHLASGSPMTKGSALATGNIETREDIDVFKFITSEAFRITTTQDLDVSNLNAGLTLKDADGNILAQNYSSSPIYQTSLRYTPSEEQTFFVEVEGTGFLDPQTNGFSDYASLGQYTLMFT